MRLADIPDSHEEQDYEKGEDFIKYCDFLSFSQKAFLCLNHLKLHSGLYIWLSMKFLGMGTKNYGYEFSIEDGKKKSNCKIKD